MSSEDKLAGSYSQAHGLEMPWDDFDDNELLTIEDYTFPNAVTELIPTEAIERARLERADLNELGE